MLDKAEYSAFQSTLNSPIVSYIDPNVTPIAQPHRRIPFHLQKMVEKEIETLLAQDIIEPVKGPTEWVSPIVTPIKPNDLSRVRLCLDMRAANQAILRTRYVTPTLDDLVHDLTGSTSWIYPVAIHSWYCIQTAETLAHSQHMSVFQI